MIEFNWPKEIADELKQAFVEVQREFIGIPITDFEIALAGRVDSILFLFKRWRLRDAIMMDVKKFATTADSQSIRVNAI